MDSRYCTYVIRSSKTGRWLGNHGKWVKTLKCAKRFFDEQEAYTRSGWFSDSVHHHIEEAEKL